MGADDKNNQLWAMSPEELTKYMIERAHNQILGDVGLAQRVLEARALVAMERTARYTLWMTVATVLLAVVTVAVTLIRPS